MIMKYLKTTTHLFLKSLLAMALLVPDVAWAEDTNEPESEVKFGNIYIGDNVIDLDDSESVIEFSSDYLSIDIRKMAEDTCVVLTLNGYEYEGPGVNGVGGIKYSGLHPLVLDLNGMNKISITGDPNNEGATAGVFGQILILTGDGSLEVNMAPSVRYGVGVMARYLLSTSPYVMEEWEMSATDYKFFTGKVTVNNYGENSAIGIYPVFEGYLGGGEYELNVFAEGQNKIGLMGGLKFLADATQITIDCPHGRGLAMPGNTRFIDALVEVSADCGYFSTELPPVVESTQAGVEYIVMAGEDAQSAVTVDLQAEDVIAILQAAKYLKICESSQTGTALQTIVAGTDSTTGYSYNLLGQRVSATYNGVVIKHGKKL